MKRPALIIALAACSAALPTAPAKSFVNRADLEAALESDEVALLPDHVEPLNISLRLDGRSRIGEKDLAHQAEYLGARPAALGLLYAIAGPTRAWLGYYEALHFAKTHAPAPAPLPVPDIAALVQHEIPPPQDVERPWWQRALTP